MLFCLIVILARIISEAAAGIVAVGCGDGLEAQQVLRVTLCRSMEYVSES